MWVEGERGVGTTFFFRIPLETPPPLVGNPARWIVPDARVGERGRQSAPLASNVLPQLAVVESGNVLHNLLERHLQNVEIVAFADLQEALKNAESNIYQGLIVNDIRLAHAMSTIGMLPSVPPHLPFLFCDVPDRTRIISELGLHDYLVKPISSDALLRTIDRLEVPPGQILLVDDNLDAVKLLRRFLASARRGYRVYHATNGYQALALLEKHRIDLILMDLAMPEMDGMQFLDLRREDPILRQIPVILTTARDPQEPSNSCQTIAVTYRDGISTSRLIGTIQNIIQVFGSHSPPAGPAPAETSPA
jgi:CheY-like chemotaxis protein